MNYNIEMTSEGFLRKSQEDNWAEEMAWQHAKSLVLANNVKYADDDFAEAYRQYIPRYRECAQHIGFLHQLAAQVLLELMDCGINSVFPDGISEEEMHSRLTQAVTVVLSGLAWAHATRPDGWTDNEEFNGKDAAERTTIFSMHKEESHEENND